MVKPHKSQNAPYPPASAGPSIIICYCDSKVSMVTKHVLTLQHKIDTVFKVVFTRDRIRLELIRNWYG